jgi:hypothetical protein
MINPWTKVLLLRGILTLYFENKFFYGIYFINFLQYHATLEDLDIAYNQMVKWVDKDYRVFFWYHWVEMVGGN